MGASNPTYLTRRRACSPNVFSAPHARFIPTLAFRLAAWFFYRARLLYPPDDTALRSKTYPLIPMCRLSGAVVTAYSGTILRRSPAFCFLARQSRLPQRHRAMDPLSTLKGPPKSARKTPGIGAAEGCSLGRRIIVRLVPGGRGRPDGGIGPYDAGKGFPKDHSLWRWFTRGAQKTGPAARFSLLLFLLLLQQSQQVLPVLGLF